jgi:predicted ATPase
MAPVLLIATYRPGFEPPWDARSDVTPMLLSRFTRNQIGTLVRKATRGNELPDAWVAEVARRSDGVPLFAEELTKTALESRREPSARGEVPELRIPETIQDALAARLDALGPVKELAQLGSVLGREFSYRLLREVSPLDEPELQQALEAAVREELLYHRGTPPEATYLFKHAMIRDAAYQSLLRTTRQRHHRRVAETLIDRLPQVAAAHPELIAHHLTEAGQAKRAIAYWQQAGQRAIARSANVEAIRQLDGGLEGVAMLPDGPDQAQQELELRTLLGIALISSEGYGSETVEQNFARARELCGTIGESPQLFRVLYGLWLFSIARAEGAAAVEAAERMFRFAEHSADPALRVHGHYVMGVTAFHRGEHRRAGEHLESSLALYDPIAHRTHALVYGRDPAVLSRSYAGVSLWHAGYPEQALESLERAMILAREVSHPYTLALGLTMSLVLRILRREPTEVEPLATECLELAREQVFRMVLGPALYMRAWARGPADREVTAALEQGEAAHRDVGSRFHLSLMLAVTAEHYRSVSLPEKALGKLDDALKIAERGLERYYLPEVHRLKGEVLAEVAAGEPAPIEACFQTALALAREQGARSLELRAATSLARLWQRQAKPAEARALLAPVYDWFTEGFDTQDLKDAKTLLEELA